jgi:ABC-2 type transport system permease protein
LVIDSADVVFSPEQGDIKKSVPTAISLTRQVNGKEQRIVVTSDADVMSTRELVKARYANFAFNTAVFSWLHYGKFPIDTSRPEAKDKRVNVSIAQVETIKIIFIWIVPGLLLVAGAILLIRRKRK